MASAGCAVCGTITSLVCIDCKAANYCSVDCQTKDKPLHDLLCAEAVRFPGTQPRPYYHLALFMDGNATDNKHFKLVWVKSRLHKSGDAESNLISELDEWLGDGEKLSVSHTLHERTIQVWNAICDESLGDAGLWDLVSGGKNLSMLFDAYPIRFRGSIIIMGMDFKTGNSAVPTYRDFTLNDLRVASDFFLSDTYILELQEEEEVNPYIIFDDSKWLKAVKISNNAEVERHTRDRFRQVLLNKNHKHIEKHDDASAITRRMGIPLLFRRCPFVVDYGPGEDPMHENPAAFYMLADIDTSDESESWGRFSYPKYDSGRDPTFLVFREDKEDITPHQVEALSEYCRNFLVDVLFDDYERCTEREKDEGLDLYCSAQKFTEFFESLKQERIDDGDKSWVDATVPPGMRRHELKGDLSNFSKREREVLPAHASASEIMEEDSEFGDGIGDMDTDLVQLVEG